MKLYRTGKGNILDTGNHYYLIYEQWDDIINRDDLFEYLTRITENNATLDRQQANDLISNELLSVTQSQEVWAAGVTYMRSRDARMEESKTSGGASFYDKVYEAERPELFFKSLPHRVSAHGQELYIRKDSTWNVPEPELTLFINSNGNIQAYTIGNDMSSRSIEGENPLYLPQAKTYERSAALGPCLYIPGKAISPETNLTMKILRAGEIMYSDSVQINRIKRSFRELAAYLFREMQFGTGCFLMTGTCLVPPDTFTLMPGDLSSITIDHIGTLENTISYNPLTNY